MAKDDLNIKHYNNTYFVDITLEGINSRGSKNSCMKTYMNHKNQWYCIGGGGVWYNVLRTREREYRKVYRNLTQNEIYKVWSESYRDEVDPYWDSFGAMIESKDSILGKLKSKMRDYRLKQLSLSL